MLKEKVITKDLKYKITNKIANKIENMIFENLQKELFNKGNPDDYIKEEEVIEIISMTLIISQIATYGRLANMIADMKGKDKMTLVTLKNLTEFHIMNLQNQINHLSVN